MAALLTASAAGFRGSAAAASNTQSADIGLLSNARQARISPDVDIVWISGMAHVGDEGAGQMFVHDASIDAAYVQSHPETSFVDASGRRFRRRVQADAGAVREELHRLIVSVTDWGAVGDGETDATGAFRAAIEHWKSLPSAELLIPWGDFLITDTLVFDHPASGSLRCVGRITANLSGKVAVRIGKEEEFCYGMRISGLKVRRPTFDMDAAGTTSNSVGVELRNLAFSSIEIAEVYNFTDNVVCKGFGRSETAVGFAYNHIQLGYLHDGKRNLVLTASENGFCNENNFFGGSFNHNSSYPNTSAVVNLEIEHHIRNSLNLNRFWGPSFEDNHPRAVAAIINGYANYLIRPRMENSVDPDSYLIHFTANSLECEVEAGAVIYHSNIRDEGRENSWSTKEGRMMRSQTPHEADKAVLTLHGNVTSRAKILRGLDSMGAETSHIDGQGAAHFARFVTAREGLRFGVGADRGLFMGSGSPERVIRAGPGSLYVNLNGGTGGTLYVKERGMGTTGWIAK